MLQQEQLFGANEANSKQKYKLKSSKGHHMLIGLDLYAIVIVYYNESGVLFNSATRHSTFISYDKLENMKPNIIECQLIVFVYIFFSF